MGDKTKIEWTDATWNPIRGCSVVSEGCRNCYAMQVAARFSGEGQAYEGLAYRNGSGAHWTGKVRLIEEHLADPLRWKRPRRIFVNSMSDLFHEKVSDKQIEAIFMIMAACSPDAFVRQANKNPVHTFQILTKRPERMREFVTTHQFRSGKTLAETILPNVWLGVSCEDQKTADERIPLLLQTPAALRWVSAEPVLGPILLDNGASSWLTCDASESIEESCVTYLEGGREHFRGIDWVVAGGESGPGARPMHPDWVRSLRDQCQAANVPFFFKQWGAWFPMTRDVESRARLQHDSQFHIWPDEGHESTVSKRVGKKAAGATLDGREHREYPS